jgi:PAS domain S-box-containing protein
MTLTRSAARSTGFAVLYLLAGYAGRLTVLDKTNLNLVWPAAGVLAVWFVAQRDSRWRALDAVALAGVTLLLDLITGSPPALAGCFVVANLVQGLLFAELHRRWMRAGALTRLVDLWRLIAAAAISTTAGALIGPTAVWLLTGTYTWSAPMVWLARNSVAILLVGTAGWHLRSLLRIKLTWEYLAVTAVSVGACAIAFGPEHFVSVPFALTGVTIWAALRLRTAFVVMHSLAFGAAAILLTLAGRGPFAQIESHPLRALVLQFFVGTVAVVGLALALSRDERAALLDQLRASERAATAQAHLLTTIIDSMDEGLGVIDETGRFVLRNPAAGRLLGFVSEGDQVKTSSRYGLCYPDGTPVADEDMPHRRAFAGQELQAKDFLVRNPALPGGRIISLNTSLLAGTDEGPRQAVVVFHDVTADRRHRDELTSFAGVVAHDLLNPLATVEGWAEELQEELTEDGVRRIARAAARMRTLIDELLTYTTARDATLSPAPVNLTDLVRGITLARIDQAQGGPGPVPQFTIAALDDVQADPVLVRQLLENLIGNAVKYASPGIRPTVSVISTRLGDQVEVTVRDNGIGIPPGQHEAIFDNFHRAHPGSAYPGTGLGLAICKRIVERHGGTITASDNGPNGGACMTFTLPGAAVAASRPVDKVPHPV